MMFSNQPTWFYVYANGKDLDNIGDLDGDGLMILVLAVE